MRLVVALRRLALGEFDEDHAESSATLLSGILIAAFSWLLRFSSVVQDVLLSLPSFQSLVLRAFQPRYKAALAAAVKPPNPRLSCFDDLGGYYVDPAARQVLQFAALHALSTHLQADEMLAPGQLLPQVSRVLLQTEEAPASKYLEAVAAALAAQMSAGLVTVDGMLLASLASATFGGPPEAYLSAFSGGGGGGASRVAAKLELAWQALRDGLFSLEQPTVCFIRNAEQLLCSSPEAYDAFSAALGQGQDAAMDALEGCAPRAPLVLLGGICVSESAAARTGKGAQRSGSGWEEEEDDMRLRPGGSGSDGLEDDDLGGLGDLLLSLRKLSGEGQQRPNPRRMLLRVFPTSVTLKPPPAGPAAVRHQQRMQQDAAEEAEEENFRAAKGVAASTGVALPPKSSGLYVAGGSGRPLSRADWSKALSWAVAMQTLLAKRQQVAEQRQREAEEGERQLAVLQEEAARAAAPAGVGASRQGGAETETGQPDMATATGLRQRRTAANSREAAAGNAWRQAARSSQLAKQAALDAFTLASSLWQALVIKPWRLAVDSVYLLLRAARWAACRLPVVGGTLEDILEEVDSGVDVWLEMRRLDAQLDQLEREVAAAGGGSGARCGRDALHNGNGSSAADSALLVGSGSSRSGGSGLLELGEEAVQYGLSMLQRSAGSPKQAVQPSNSYERQLLAEVLSPEDCGRGFQEVGALQEAKTALREAVQLPLQHPELFAAGTLARPSKGVLLFGPPGTGKTLVARAAAAECGAAFLAISPSAITSKWLGDTVKFVRAAFSLAAKLSPCVLFIDEVDALLGRRNSQKEHEALREMKNEFMAQWDGIRPGRERIMVLGATNRPFDLDEAVLRRFTHRIFVGLPDKAARAAILTVVLEGEQLDADADVARLAEQTEGYSGSDLKQLCVQAAMRPVRTLLEQDSRAAAAAAVADVAEEEVSAGGSSGATAAAAAAASAVQPNGKQRLGNGGSDGAAEEDAATHAASGTTLDSEKEQTGTVASDAAAVAAAEAGQPASPAAVSGGSLQLVPRLDSLLRQAQRMARTPRNPKKDLRPISMQDFEEALKEVGASVNPESATVSELMEWNEQYGTSGGKQGVRNKRLSYFT